MGQNHEMNSKEMDLCQLDNTYEIPEARRHCTMEQLTGQNFSILSIFNSKLCDTNFSNLILILPEVHILYVTSQK